MEVDKKDVQENATMAALAYISVLCFVPLIARRKSKFAKFHAKQGLLLFLVEVLFSWFFTIPVIGWALGFIVTLLAVLGVLNALSGNFWEMPFLGRYASKLKI